MEKILFFIVVYIVVNFQKIILNNHKFKKRSMKNEMWAWDYELNIAELHCGLKIEFLTLKYECIFTVYLFPFAWWVFFW